MPYAFAHPAAVVPVAKLLGRRAVPSALAIGSMIPDAWYLVPLLTRDQSHSFAGALFFCLPAGLIAYLAFHLVFKQPMLALLPQRCATRAAAWTAPALPDVALRRVLLSLALGIATHLAWDAFTHAGHFALVETRVYGVRLHRVLQHASTLIGSAALGWWVWRKLLATPPSRSVPAIRPQVRAAALAALVVVPLAAFFAVLDGVEVHQWREALRSGAVSALRAFALVALCYAVIHTTSAARANP